MGEIRVSVKIANGIVDVRFTPDGCDWLYQTMSPRQFEVALNDRLQTFSGAKVRDDGKTEKAIEADLQALVDRLLAADRIAVHL